MASSVKQKPKCKTGNCSIKKTNQNGKGDKTRPFSKHKYDTNYESINWKRK